MIDSNEFNITKTCPFLNKPCIKDDCPSFTVNFFSFPKFTDVVILLKEEKKLLGTKTEKEGWGLFVGWNERYTPACQVLSAPDYSRWHSQNNVPVGDMIQKFSKGTTRWVKRNGWCLSDRKVTELPDVQSSTSTARKEQ